jgi:hypothetical protein
MSIATISAYVKLHEKLIAIVLGAALIYAAYGKVENIIARHDDANLKQAQVTLQAQASKDAVLATQASQQAEQYKELAAKVDTENAALVNANATLAAALTRQQKTDATLPPIELVARLNTLVPTAGATFTPNGVTLPEAGAVATVQQLEKVPVLTQELSNSQAEAKNDLSLLTASTGQVATLNSEVSGLRLENTDEKNVCTQQLRVQADAARKRERRIGIIGAVIGVILRSMIK